MDTASARQAMVDHHLKAAGIRDPRVLAAMGTVPREAFVPAELRDLAYANRPLRIGHGQTISQPFIVALMIEAARIAPGERVLEVGAGSGYAAAVMGQIGGQVYGIERIGALAAAARDALHRIGCTNIDIIEADGTQGWPQAAPYDAIIVSAGGPDVPPPLRGQLALGGRLVIPVGRDREMQRLVRVTRTGEAAFTEDDLGPVAFVPLIGSAGWPET
jgi:protein-L-isoaspartate(D-aspartate) O-methyltransferase